MSDDCHAVGLLCFVFMPWAYCFGLVRLSIRPFVRTIIKLGFLNFIDGFLMKNIDPYYLKSGLSPFVELCPFYRSK